MLCNAAFTNNQFVSNDNYFFIYNLTHWQNNKHNFMFYVVYTV